MQLSPTYPLQNDFLQVQTEDDVGAGLSVFQVQGMRDLGRAVTGSASFQEGASAASVLFHIVKFEGVQAKRGVGSRLEKCLTHLLRRCDV